MRNDFDKGDQMRRIKRVTDEDTTRRDIRFGDELGGKEAGGGGGDDNVWACVLVDGGYDALFEFEAFRAVLPNISLYLQCSYIISRILKKFVRVGEFLPLGRNPPWAVSL